MKLRNLEVSLDEILAEGNIREFAGNDEPAKALLKSIKAVGVLNPVLLAPRKGKPKYLLVSGFRRYTAACEAGHEKIPARLMEGLTEARITEIRLSENLHRLDMTAIEEGEAVKRLMADAHLSQDEVGVRLGRSQTWVSFRLRMLGLPAPVQERIRKRELSATAAMRLVPYIGHNTDAFLVRAATAAAQSEAATRHSALNAALVSGERRTYMPREAVDGPCPCRCRCCLASAAHTAGQGLGAAR